MICKSCGEVFTEKAPHQKYCSDRCRWRDHKRKTYEDRVNEGLCPQCGDEMDTRSRPSYCVNCQKYFSDRYYDSKEG